VGNLTHPTIQRYLENIVAWLETSSWMAIGHKSNSIACGVPGRHALIEFAVGKPSWLLKPQGIDEPELTKTIVEPSPIVEAIWKPGDSFGPPRAYLFGEISQGGNPALGNGTDVAAVW
jgi:hypothetical protein